MMIQMGASNTLIQSMVPDHLRGRVMSVYSMMFMGMAPIGSLLAGAAADRVGRARPRSRRPASSAWPARLVFRLELPRLAGAARAR